MISATPDAPYWIYGVSIAMTNGEALELAGKWCHKSFQQLTTDTAGRFGPVMDIAIKEIM